MRKGFIPMNLLEGSSETNIAKGKCDFVVLKLQNIRIFVVCKQQKNASYIKFPRYFIANYQ